jgi:DNA polymerase-3 subunit epsilon
MLGVVERWTRGEVLGLDLETTGVDRFNDIPVSYALVSVVDGFVRTSWSGLIDPGRDVPADATAVHGITTERAHSDGMPLPVAIHLLCDAVLAASARGVPLAGMKLDYDLTLLDSQAKAHGLRGLAERGWHGPVLDVAVLDRQFDPDRHGHRTLIDLCAHYGIEFARAHDAAADAVASVEVLYALAMRWDELCDADLGVLHRSQIEWHRHWAERHDEWRMANEMIPIDPRDYVWPVAPAVVSRVA